MATNSIDVLLFDLGGVLVDFSGVRDIATLLPTQAEPAEIVDRWSRCPHSRSFGLGKLTPQQFAERFVSDWGIRLHPSEFLQEYRSWSRGFFPGAEELLIELRARFRVAALSNSDEVHWDRNVRDLGLTNFFDLAVSSHEVGLRKPDPAIYVLMLKTLGVSPESVLYFDDSETNVVAASRVGLRARRVAGVKEARACLVRENVV
jgi:epoxide hydrolase-like predicted phosphatase